MSEASHKPESRIIQLDPQVIELADEWRSTWHSPNSGPLTQHDTIPSWMPGDVQASMSSEIMARGKLVTHVAVSMVFAGEGQYADTAQRISDSLQTAFPGREFAELGPRLLVDAWARSVEMIRGQSIS